MEEGGGRRHHVASQEERDQQQPKKKDVRIEVRPWPCSDTQIGRNDLIYKRELAS